MDLESTLVRAESLFRRFQRTVETIDKKGNFPSAPQARQRKSVAGAAAPADGNSNGNNTAEASTSATSNGKQPVGDQDARVISAELRTLLSRQVEKVEKEDTAKQGSSSGGGAGGS